MARAHGNRRERPDEWVVDGLAVVAPILEATWAPRAGCLLQLVYGKGPRSRSATLGIAGRAGQSPPRVRAPFVEPVNECCSVPSSRYARRQ
jgi:hypothetical protein